MKGGTNMARKAITAASNKRRAALKAWRTRRENARKRSEAAKKAWRTRRNAL